jgi:hypothetical protein
MQALVDDNFGTLNYTSGITEAFAISGWRNFSAILNYQNIKTGDFLTDTKDESYIWSYGCGGGTFIDCKGIGSTTDFVNQSPKTVFTALYGSRFGDWDSENNFMRAALASNGWILTCCWAGRQQYTFHQMGMGETIGHCVRATQNNINTYYYGAEKTKRGIQVGLQGDPALRMHIVRPVNSLKSAITTNKTIMLTWNQADDSIVGYYIYKLDALTNKYNRISETPVAETHFEDVSPDEGNNYYMVRTLKLSEVVSGSYYNLSQGIFDTIRYKQPVLSQISRANLLPKSENLQPGKIDEGLNTGVEITQSNITSKEVTDITKELLVYPNPSTGLFNISFGSSPVREATIKIYNIQGKIMQGATYENATLERFDIGTLPRGIYIVSGVIDGKNMSTKISLQ